MDDFENLSEEDIQALMELGIIPDEYQGLQEQIEQAQKLRNREGPQGTHTGRVYVAASPLEHLSHTLQGMKAGKDLDRMRAEQQALLQRQVSGRGKYFNRLMDTPERRANSSFMEDLEMDPYLVGGPRVNF
jgi:hypothetical protein